MTSLAGAIVAAGVLLLPEQERRRYAEELDSELQSQPRWRRLPYAVSLLLGIPHLRWEILRRLAGRPVPFCFVGMHRNVTVHPNPEDASIIARQCILCHRTHDPRQYIRRENPQGLGWIAAGPGN